MKLTTYQTHKLIKAEIKDAMTVYERENRGQMTFEEYIDLAVQELKQEHQLEHSMNLSSMINRLM